MNYSAYEISELLKMLEAENRAVAIRSKIFTFLLGLSYMAIGLCCWAETARTWSLLWQAGGFLSALVAWPLLMSVFSKWNRLLGHWPRCPECQTKLEEFNPALRRCPKCWHIIVSDRRVLLPGYVPPESDALKPRNPNQKSGSIGQLIGSLLFLAVLFIPCLLAKAIISRDEGNMDIPSITANLLVFLGVIVMFFHGGAVLCFEKLIAFMVWIDRKCDRLNRKLDKNYQSALSNPAHQCPHCHHEPNHRLAAITGNCNLCGGPILSVPVEPDTPEMMDWRKLRQYQKILEIGFWYLCGICIPGLYVCKFLLKTDADSWLICLIAGGVAVGIPAIWNFVFLRVLRRKWNLNFHCRFCNYHNGSSNNAASWRFFLMTGHCSNCRRKLVRDEASGPAEGTEAGK